MQFVNLHTHRFSNNELVLEIVNQYPWEFDPSISRYSIGIHPWHIDKNRLENDLKMIEDQLKLHECLALGECGLDKRIEMDFEFQKSVFIKQILLAEKFQKPLIIHCVAAFQELIQIKNKYKITVPIVIHGFSKNEQLANQLIKNGFYISFGKYLIQNKELETVFQSIPNDRFFLETDSSDYKIEEVYQLASKYKNWTSKTLKNQIHNNYKNVFKQ